MSRRKKIMLIIAWLVFATFALAYVCGNVPGAFPRPPESFAIWLSNLYGAQDAEALLDLELIYLFVVSFAVVFVCTAFVLFVWRRIHKPHDQAI